MRFHSLVHQAQVISYLKLSGRSLGLLINFNVVHLKDGIKRFVNGTGVEKESPNLLDQPRTLIRSHEGKL